MPNSQDETSFVGVVDVVEEEKVVEQRPLPAQRQCWGGGEIDALTG